MEFAMHISNEVIEQKIHLIRGRKVILDRDLAVWYGVSTGALNQAVKRNSERFPDDFMFQLSREETAKWRSQFVMSNSARMGIRNRPYAFTENGIAMLSSVLRSSEAIQVNIQIMRAFTSLRQMLQSHRRLWHKIEEMEKTYDKQFKVVFQALRELLEKPGDSKRKIGFHE
jgi:hypothetical protein